MMMKLYLQFLIACLLAGVFADVEPGYNETCLAVNTVCDSMLGSAGICCEGLYCPPPILDVAYCTPLDQGYDRRSCGKLGAMCGERAGNVPCCLGNFCDIHVNEGTCVDRFPTCVQEEGICATEIGPIVPCCPGTYCDSEVVGPLHRCKKSLTCLYEGDTCVAFAGPTGICCGNTHCVMKAFDYGVCEKIDTCQSEDSPCSKISGECCGDLVCSLLGAGNGLCKRPVVDPDPIPEPDPEGCLHPGSPCTEIEGPEGGCCPGYSCQGPGAILKCK